MADLGGALLGFAVDKLLEEVLSAIRHVKNRSANLLELQNLLEILQPSVQELSIEVRDEKHPAGKWMLKLREQLEMAGDLVNASSNVHKNIFKMVRISKTSLELYASIQALLPQASALLLASGVSDHQFQAEARAKLTEMTASQEKIERLLHGLATLDPAVNATRAMSDLLAEVSDARIANRSGSSSAAEDQRLSEDVPKPEVTFGGESVANELIDHLVNGDYKKWVGLWGMGGIGKSFTARQVYHDSHIRQHFSGGVFWLTVSKDQPGPRHLFKQLLEKVQPHASVSQLPDSLDGAKFYLTSMLDSDRVLLVLDDVWQKDVLEHLDVISESKKGVILVTTRDEGVLQRVMDFADIVEIQPLSEEDSWRLFSWYSFHVRRRVIPSDLESVAKAVARECGGLPLALEVIGSAMADRELVPHVRTLGLTSLRIWEIALERLRSANHVENEYGKLYRKLQVSVDSLDEQDSRLRDCFFYFAAFAEDELIDVERLVNVWIAEGLVQEDGKSSFTAEEQGKVLLGFLVAKSMIKVTKSGSSCGMHDVMRDLAQWNLKWNFAAGEEIKAPYRNCLYAPGWQESELPKEWTVVPSSSAARRLSLRRNELQEFPGEWFNAPRLQVLILSVNWQLRSVSPGFFYQLSDLRVLDLSDTSIPEIPSEIWRRLKSLVLLNLSHCDRLQEMIIDRNSLPSLEFLYLDDCPMLQCLPMVSHMTKLKVYLASVPLASSTKRVRWFKHFLGGGGGHRDDKWRRSMSGTPYRLPVGLKRLEISTFSDHDYSGRGGEKYSFGFSSLCALEELTLTSLSSFPSGMENLRCLKVLKIRQCWGVPVPALGKLALLEELEMQFYSSSGSESYGHTGSFPSLNKFRIECKWSMEKMFIFYPGTMPKLEILDVHFSTKEQMPTSITNLHSLKSLKVVIEDVSTDFASDESDAKGVSHLSDEDLEFLFTDPDDFPDLENFAILGYVTFRPGHSTINLPKHFLERQEQGFLTITV